MARRLWRVALPDRIGYAPAVTYRLQLHRGFTFDDARELVPYLDALGVTDCYCSPIFRAVAGSTHGYDVSHHAEINPELGGDTAFAAFADALAARGIGLLLDFVPNHMSNDPRTNDWWRDVLENGPSSPFADYFDIDWEPTKAELENRLLLPILGEPYGDTLERGALQLQFDRGSLVLRYGDLPIPLNPRRTPLVYESDLDSLEATLGPDSAALREFLSILTALRNLPAYTERDPGRVLERQREKEVARERLDRLSADDPAIRSHIERAIARYNGVPGEPRSFDRLHELLELQAYRLASWRTASDEINFRRFFDINQLAALRVEDARVFDEIHRLVLALAAAGRITGLRLDHVDGLFDPAAYFSRLRAALAGAAGDRGRDLYVVVEKILSAGERLRQDWAIDGTTGYTFLNELNGLFVDRRGARKLWRTYARVSGHDEPFADVAYDSKRLIVSTALASEFQVLAHAINRLSEADWSTRDFTLGTIRRALREVVACFPAYRTYVTADGATPEDAAMVGAAIAGALERNPALEPSTFEFLRAVMAPSPATPADDATASARLNVAMRLQQYTAPVQAKGLEDTAFYRYHVLISLNEVGGDPRLVGRSVDAFHAANGERRQRWPDDMLATTTHDTKRAEDARARINVLSEMPDAWSAAVTRWRRITARNRTRLAGGGQAPDAADEYLFYQTLVGCWPIALHERPVIEGAPADLVSRLTHYMEKAIREAKRRTSWISPNVEYEAGVSRFVTGCLHGRTATEFLVAFQPFVARVATAGMVNSLAQLALKIGAPGVADFYQGTELWDQSLVDPDNRRPVDYQSRRRMLDTMDPVVTPSMMAGWTDGRLKLCITASGMRLRREHRSLFRHGEYHAVATEGPWADHVVAFERRLGDERLLVVAPRLTTFLPRTRGGVPLGREAWADTMLRIPELVRGRRYVDRLTGRLAPLAARSTDGLLPVGDLLEVCPVALLWLE